MRILSNKQMFLLWIQWMELKYKDGYLQRPMSHQHTEEPSKGSLGQKGPWEAESFLKLKQAISASLAPHQYALEKSSSWSHGCTLCPLQLQNSLPRSSSSRPRSDVWGPLRAAVAPQAATHAGSFPREKLVQIWPKSQWRRQMHWDDWLITVLSRVLLMKNVHRRWGLSLKREDWYIQTQMARGRAPRSTQRSKKSSSQRRHSTAPETGSHQPCTCYR